MISKINKNSKELASAIGHIFGDGGINSKGRVYYCNSEEFLIKEFVNCMSKIFGIKPWIKKEKNITRVVYPVSAGRKLWDLFGKFSFGKDTKIITPLIKKMSLKWKVIMLQAWFNDDGSVVNIPPNYKVVAIHQKLKHLINFIEEVLNEFQIKSRVEEDNKKWLLRIFGYKDIVRFRDNINFSVDYRKREQLGKMIKTITHPHSIIKNKILELLKDSSKTTKEISQRLGMNRYVVYGHLHGWKRKNKKSNKGLIDLGLVKFEKESRKNIYFLSESKNQILSLVNLMKFREVLL
jgi:predicted transcriptional regulator with HTH domain